MARLTKTCVKPSDSVIQNPPRGKSPLMLENIVDLEIQTTHAIELENLASYANGGCMFVRGIFS